MSKYSEKSKIASRRLLWKSIIILFAILFAGMVASLLHAFLAAITGFVIFVWLVIAGFILYFFRDPEPAVPEGEMTIVSPGHGTVDFVGEGLEQDYLGIPCKRISIFLSIFNVHVQNAPIAGKVEMLKYTKGSFVNAMSLASATQNENMLFGFQNDAGRKVSMRLIAGLIARRIVPFVELNERVEKGERISLIQFGSRVDVYLPLGAEICVANGAKVVGGETVIAMFH